MPNKKILVVDNNPVLVKVVISFLEHAGYEVMTAPDGLSALDILHENTPDIVIVDLIMPNISGSQLCRIIRDTPHLKDVFIIILSAIVAEEGMAPAELGADVCIAKGPARNMTKHLATALELAQAKSDRNKVEPMSIGFDEVFQREITKELLASKHETEVLLNNMEEGIFELSPSDNRIIYANPAALALIGQPEEKVLGRHFVSLFEKKQQQRIAPLLSETITIPLYITDENPVILKKYQVTLHFLPPAEDAGGNFMVIVRDVTAQKTSEEALKKAQAGLEKRVALRTRELSLANQRLSEEIIKRRSAAEELERRTLELEEANTALRVLLKQSSEAKHELEDKVLANIKSLVDPFLDELAMKLAGRSEEVYLNILRANLEEITSSFTQHLSTKFKDLTPREIQVANLIRQGRTNKEIAQLLNLSVRTIEFYRDNLRQKLKIKNKKTNLRSLLLTLPFK